MNRLSTEKRAQVIGCLVEGMSIRATSRLIGVSTNTIDKLLGDRGDACSAYMNEVMVNLPCTTIEADEIWSFIGAKAKNVKPDHPQEFGDVWTWVAIDADTKLVPSYYVGSRDAAD